MSKDLWFGKYEVIKLLGEGATSKVYLVKHMDLEQYRAIKCITKSLITVEQAKQEASLLLKLRSPAIPTIYDVEEDEMHLYIIEEYMEGESLFSYRSQTQEISESIILKLSLQICQLIKYLHSMKIPILYLDLKPSNFIIDHEQLRLIDFGSARLKNGKQSNCNYGTRGYAAPEQYCNSSLDETCDIYGIGMLLYFLITGNVHPDKKDLKEIRLVKGYSKELLDLVAGSIKHNPCERYTSVEMLERKIQKINKHYNEKKHKTNPSKKIALIGSQNHVGVTHLAFMILSYLTKKGKRTIYVECNPSRLLVTLVTYAAKQTEEYFYYRNCIFTMADWTDEDILKEYDYIIYDYGSITDANYEQFLLADKRIALLGGREWEDYQSERLQQRLQNQQDVLYVMNHITAQKFYARLHRTKQGPIYRMPLECDPFSSKAQLTVDLIEALMN